MAGIVAMGHALGFLAQALVPPFARLRAASGMGAHPGSDGRPGAAWWNPFRHRGGQGGKGDEDKGWGKDGGPRPTRAALRLHAAAVEAERALDPLGEWRAAWACTAQGGWGAWWCGGGAAMPWPALL